MLLKQVKMQRRQVSQFLLRLRLLLPSMVVAVTMLVLLAGGALQRMLIQPLNVQKDLDLF
jgi:hypothetical protein